MKRPARLINENVLQHMSPVRPCDESVTCGFCGMPSVCQSAPRYSLGCAVHTRRLACGGINVVSLLTVLALIASAPTVGFAQTFGSTKNTGDGIGNSINFPPLPTPTSTIGVPLPGSAPVQSVTIPIVPTVPIKGVPGAADSGAQTTGRAGGALMPLAPITPPAPQPGFDLGTPKLRSGAATGGATASMETAGGGSIPPTLVPATSVVQPTSAAPATTQSAVLSNQRVQSLHSTLPNRPELTSASNPNTTTRPASGASVKPDAAGVASGSDAPVKISSNATVGTSTTRNSALAYDSVITTRLAAQIMADPSLRGAQISIASNQGTVSLDGFVLIQQQSVRAQQIAQSVAGVRLVRNALSLKR